MLIDPTRPTMSHNASSQFVLRHLLRTLASGSVLAIYLLLGPLASIASGARADPWVLLASVVNQRDVGQADALFAQDAVVIQPPLGGLAQVYVGRAQIQVWLRDLAAQNAHLEFTGPAVEIDGRIRWPGTLAADAFSELGLTHVEVITEVILSEDGK